MIDELSRAILSHYPDAIALYLFGSMASGRAGRDSDIDLALLLPGKANPVMLWQFAQTLAARAGRDVELVDLRAASTILQYQVITLGRRLWAADARAALYETFILSEKTELETRRAGLIGDIEKSGRIHGR